MLPLRLNQTLKPSTGAKMLGQAAAQITRHMLRRRRKEESNRQAVAQIQSIQRDVFRQIHSGFIERHGQLEGSRLAQLTVDRLFARPHSVEDYYSLLAEQFAAEIASENHDIRNAAFISLLTMLEVADQNAAARRRVMTTIDWLKQFGEVPAAAADPEALYRISQTLSVCLLPAQETEDAVRPASRLRTLPLISSTA